MQEEKRENMTMRALYLMAILFVVDGHVPLGEMLNFNGLFRYYSFHLMVFAFGSGYFLKRGGAVKESILHSAKRLLVPLYAFNLLYGILAALLRRFFGASIGAPLNAYTLLLAPITDGQHFVYNLGAWFIFPLFACKTMYQLADAALARVKNRDVWLLALFLIPGSLAVNLCFHGQQEKVPLFLLRIAILLPGLALGVVYRERLEKRDNLPTLPYLTGIVLLRMLLCVRYENLAYLLSDCTYFACDAFGVYAGGTLAIAFYLRIARLIAPYVRKSRLALAVSRHTFDIMMHHYMGFYALNLFFLVFNILGVGAKDFSVLSLRTKGGYVYAPGGRVEWEILYILAGIAFSLAAAWMIEKLKGQAKKLKKQ